MRSAGDAREIGYRERDNTLKIFCSKKPAGLLFFLQCRDSLIDEALKYQSFAIVLDPWHIVFVACFLRTQLLLNQKHEGFLGRYYEDYKNKSTLSRYNRGEAGELGRRIKGRAKFLKNGQSPTTFFASAFLDFESINTGNVQPSHSSAEKPCAERVTKKVRFFECRSKLSSFVI